MIRVPVRGERRSIPATDLQYVGQPVGWAGQWPHGGSMIELRIGGGEESPDRALVALPELVLPHLDAVEAASDAYLQGFIRHAEGFYAGSWRLRSLQLEWPPRARASMATGFEVTLAIGNDEHGEWRVGFRHHTNPVEELVPWCFSRRQW